MAGGSAASSVGVCGLLGTGGFWEALLVGNHGLLGTVWALLLYLGVP